MRPEFWFGMAAVMIGLVVMAYGAWPNRENPKEYMTLLMWGPETGGVGSQEWISGALSQEKALEWRVWQPPGYQLKHRVVIEGRPAVL
jgi:hypothetical protein